MQRFLTDETSTFSPSVLRPRFTSKPSEMRLVKAYPDLTYQRIIGFGAALTEASGFVFANMDADARRRFIDLCFGKDGNRYSLCRTPIQSCDFSLGPRAYMRDRRDAELSSFSIEGDRTYLIPLIKAAQERNPDLGFIASPWSPPAWSKTNHMMVAGGTLKRKYYRVWAQMIARYLRAYRDEGISIARITVQNEPQARQIWESCLFTAEQERDFVRDHLRPVLDSSGLDDVAIEIWDHNKESMLDRTLAFMSDPDAAASIGGVAFHWYSGDHFEAIRAVRKLIGDRDIIFSEGCDSYSAGDRSRELPHAEHYAHEVIGDLEAGANAIIDWNILLDAMGGPNHVGNYCDAPIMFYADDPVGNPAPDTGRHSLPDDCCSALPGGAGGTLRVRLPFHYLGHFSRFIEPGAVRMLVTRYTTDLETCGFVNPDGGKVLVALNRTEYEIPFSLTTGDHTADTSSPAHSIMTICW